MAPRGFEGTSVEEIAAQAGVSKPVVYEHFGGKEGLYAVVVDREGSDGTWSTVTVSLAVASLPTWSSEAQLRPWGRMRSLSQSISFSDPFYFQTTRASWARKFPGPDGAGKQPVRGAFGKCRDGYRDYQGEWDDPCISGVKGTDVLSGPYKSLDGTERPCDCAIRLLAALAALG